MILEDVKKELSSRTGIPVSLLTGETIEENIAKAKAIIAYRRDHDKPQSAKEAFSLWCQEKNGDEKPDPMENVTKYENELRSLDCYPQIRDGGSVLVNGKLKGNEDPSKEFSRLASDALAFNPFRDPSGWTHIT